MNKLFKEVTETQIETDNIKTNEIYEVEDKLSCNTNIYVVVEVTKYYIVLNSLTHGIELRITSDKIHNYEFKKMKVVSEDEYTYLRGLEKLTCEKRTDAYGKMIRDMLNDKACEIRFARN